MKKVTRQEQLTLSPYFVVQRQFLPHVCGYNIFVSVHEHVKERLVLAYHFSNVVKEKKPAVKQPY